MSTDAGHLTFFVPNYEHRGETYNTDAILVTPMRAVDLVNQRWLFWVQGFDTAIPCTLRDHEWVGSGIDSAGVSITQYDNEPYLHSSSEGVSLAASNSVRLSFRLPSDQPTGKTPSRFFFNSDKQHGCTEYKALIRMSLSTLDQFPDVQAHLNFFDNAAITSNDPVPQPKVVAIVQRMLMQFNDIAHQMPPKEGMLFPVSIQQSQEVVFATVLLKKQYSVDRFDCSIFINDRIGPIAPDTVLFRDVVWHTKDANQQLHADVCTVISSEVVNSSSTNGLTI
jgi:hypothetical protein